MIWALVAAPWALLLVADVMRQRRMVRQYHDLIARCRQVSDDWKSLCMDLLADNPELMARVLAEANAAGRIVAARDLVAMVVSHRLASLAHHADDPDNPPSAASSQRGHQ